MLELTIYSGFPSLHSSYHCSLGYAEWDHILLDVVLLMVQSGGYCEDLTWMRCLASKLARFLNILRSMDNGSNSKVITTSIREVMRSF